MVEHDEYDDPKDYYQEPCDTCGAGTGDPCVTQGGNVLYGSNVHKGRIGGTARPNHLGKGGPGNTALTEKTAQTILDAIRVGLPLKRAARLANINRKTLYHWRQRGRDEPDGKYGSFLAMCQTAEAEAERNMVREVRGEGGPGARWLLARRWPERWSKEYTVRHHHAGETEGTPIKVLRFDPSEYPLPEEGADDDEADEGDGIDE